MSKKQKKYTGYGYHGGGRKPLAPEKRHRTSVTICGTMAEIEKLRALAKEADKSVSRYVLDIILPESPVACICGGATVITGQDTTATYYRCKDCGKTWELKHTAVCEFINEQCRKAMDKMLAEPAEPPIGCFYCKHMVKQQDVDNLWVGVCTLGNDCTGIACDQYKCKFDD